MDVKTVKVAIKAAGKDDGLEDGEFIGYASVFDNIDLHGDVVRKGAFTRTLEEWKTLAEETGAVIPLLYGHDTYDPNNNIGYLKLAEEDEHGLKVHGKVDLEGGNGPQVYRLIKGRRLRQMSFAYEVRDSRPGEVEGKQFTELLDLKLHEVSLVPMGANPKTELLGVKEADQLTDTITEKVVQRLIMLVKSGNLEVGGERANDPGPAKDEEPEKVKSEEPSPSASATFLSQYIDAILD